MAVIPLKADKISGPSACKASSSSSVTKEHDHGSQCQFSASSTQADTLEQRKADGGKAAAPAKARLVDPDQTTGRGTNARLGDVQPSYRQQTTWLRCRRPQGRGCCSERIFSRSGNRATKEDWAAGQVRTDGADPTSSR